MPIANENRIVFVNSKSVSQFALSASLLRFCIYSFIIHINLADFYWGGTLPIEIGWRIVLWYSVSLLQWENTHWNSLTDCAVLGMQKIRQIE